jgi:hypothetical protein
MNSPDSERAPLINNIEEVDLDIVLATKDSSAISVKRIKTQSLYSRALEMIRFLVRDDSKTLKSSKVGPLLLTSN